MEDFLVLLFLSLSTAIWMVIHRLFSFSPFRNSLSEFSSEFFEPGKFRHFPDSTAKLNRNRGLNKLASAEAGDDPNFVLSDYSLVVSRSLWRIVEFVMSDFVDHWYVYCSPNTSGANGSGVQRYNSEFPNDVRDLFEFAFNSMASRCVRVNWTHFLVKNFISNLNFLLRIYRLTETELNENNPFYSAAPEKIKQKLLKAELLRVYTLHAGVTQPQLYLRKLSTAILSKILRTEDFQCVPMISLGREVLTNNVLYLAMGFLTPYWLNVGIINVLNPYLEAKKHKKEKKNEINENRNNETEQTTNSSGGAEKEGETEGGEETNRGSQSEGNSSDSHSDSSRQIPLPSKEGLLSQKIDQWSTEKLKRKAQEKYHTMKLPSTNNNFGENNSNNFAVNNDAAIAEQPTRQHAATVAIHTKAGNIIKATPIPASNRSIQLAKQTGNSNSGGAPQLQRSLSSIPGFVASSASPRWEVRIVGAGIRFDPKPYVAYELLVSSGDAKYLIVKRFQRFEELHQRLKKSVASFDAQLPRKHFFGNLDQSFIQNRKQELQIYLGQLLWNRNVQESEDLRLFLAPEDNKIIPQQSNINQNQTVASSAPSNRLLNSAAAKDSPILNSTSNEENSFLSPISEDQSHSPPMRLSPNKNAGRRQSEATINNFQPANEEILQNSSVVAPFNPSPLLASQHSSTVFGGSAAATRERQTSASGAAQSNASNFNSSAHPHSHHSHPHSQSHSQSQSGANDFDLTDGLTDPLYILVEEMFDLNSRGWVRRQATWITKQLVKLTANKVIKNWFDQQIKFLLTEEQISIQIEWITGLIWRDGKIQPAAVISPEESEAIKKEAEELLLAAIPSSLKTLLGSNHCELSLKRFFQFLQMEPLIQHFGYSVLDSLVLELYPELQFEGLLQSQSQFNPNQAI